MSNDTFTNDPPVLPPCERCPVCDTSIPRELTRQTTRQNRRLILPELVSRIYCPGCRKLYVMVHRWTPAAGWTQITEPAQVTKGATFDRFAALGETMNPA